MTNQKDTLLIDANEAARLCGCSRRTLLTWDGNGTLGPKSIKLGRLRRWRADSIQQWAKWDCPKRRRFLEMMKDRRYDTTARATKSSPTAA